jgi:hypothetical protein
MGLKIDNAEDLKLLLQSTSIEITDADELREFLESVNASQKTPEAAKEEMAHKERLQESAQAHEERMRNLEHAERLRALELGQPLSDAGELSKTQSAVRAAGTVGTLVPLGLASAAIGSSYLILGWIRENSQVTFFGSAFDLRFGLFAIVWGVSGLVMLATVAGSLRTVRRVREWSPPQQELLATRSRPADAEAKRAIQG